MATITDFTGTKLMRVGFGTFTITGTGLSKALKVYFVDAASKTIPAKSFTIVSDMKITGECPEFSVYGVARVYVSVEEEATVDTKSNSHGGSSTPQIDYANEFYSFDTSVKLEDVMVIPWASR
ncbi:MULTISPECIES: hypothetical protein [Pandoraea]|uniref:hypothetical protein n=1 Tax=Pandoraea TaxID=93217 RepID=UPI001F5D3EB7|nr:MULTISPECIES: hypothetical protein [Pandoraea]MCI3205926.1 hypothetical protein [Pandoraea sp. LA3]MDN4583954.1 hypothetical protein [Pandoraea capi]